MKIYIVEDAGNSPGRIRACFAEIEDAQNFVDHGLFLDDPDAEFAEIIEHELVYGQKLWQ